MSVPACLLVQEVVAVIETPDQRDAGDTEWYFYGDPSSKEANCARGQVECFYGVALLDTGELIYFRWRCEEKQTSYCGLPLLGRGIYHHCEKA